MPGREVQQACCPYRALCSRESAGSGGQLAARCPHVGSHRRPHRTIDLPGTRRNAGGSLPVTRTGHRTGRVEEQQQGNTSNRAPRLREREGARGAKLPLWGDVLGILIHATTSRQGHVCFCFFCMFWRKCTWPPRSLPGPGGREDTAPCVSPCGSPGLPNGPGEVAPASRGVAERRVR